MSEKAHHGEEILKVAYSKKKKTNETPSHSNTIKTSTATSSEEAPETTTSAKTTAMKTSEAAGTTTVKTKQKQSKLTSFFKL